MRKSRFGRAARILCLAAALVAPLAAPGCRRSGPRRLVLATTTSVRDCGLLDELAAAFERETGIPIAPIAVGSGEAMRMGRDGNADALLVHDPGGEEKLVADGVAVEDVEILRSRFVVVGPAGDPAGIRGQEGAVDVFRRLAEGKAPFVSRGDDSGTHRLEKRFWQAAGIEPRGDWYLSVGAGMMHTVRVANERRGYCLIDSATWLRGRKDLDLEPLVDSAGPEWANIYSVLLLSAQRFPEANHDAARRFLQFMVSGSGRRIAAEFGRDEFGAPMFTVP